MRRHNHDLAAWVQRLLTRAWGVEPATPADGSLLGSMVTVALPDGAAARYEDHEALQNLLYDEHGIEVPVIPWQDRWWIRASCQVYNTPEQYLRLAEAVRAAVSPP